MRFEKNLDGHHIILVREARWRNTDRVSVAPVGTTLRLNSWRPEGYRCTVIRGGLFNVGEDFFLFREMFPFAILINNESEKMVRMPHGTYRLCDNCVEGIMDGQVRYLHINRAGEGAVICPDCAAVIMGETLSAYGWDFRQY